MKRSEINAAVREARAAFQRHQWALPPKPRWDVTDFGLGDFRRYGLVLVNLAEQPEYCEKIMFVRRKQTTPRHYHAAKKEDIICRWGRLAIGFPADKPAVTLQVNGEKRRIPTARPLILKAGGRITLTRRMPHAFWAESPYAIVGEVSTANDDAHDNYFEDERVGRFNRIVEDEPAIVTLVSD
ncbi:MAG: D-lyxose/D-mannose family sugar isomerase [Planctomycetota bacterium]